MTHDGASEEPSRDIVDKLVVARDEALSDDELRSRWKFQQPLGQLQFLAVIGLVVGIVLMLAGNLQNGLWLFGGSFVTLPAVFLWLRYRVSKLTREEMIAGIQVMREIHSDSDM